MIKNGIISLMAAVMLTGAECYADCRGAVILGFFAVGIVVTSMIEDLYDRIHTQIFKRRRLQRQITGLVKSKEGVTDFGSSHDRG